MKTGYLYMGEMDFYIWINGLGEFISKVGEMDGTRFWCVRATLETRQAFFRCQYFKLLLRVSGKGV